MTDIYTEIKKSLIMKMKLMDTTIKGIDESSEYRDVCIYNSGISEAIRVVEKYKDILAEYKE